MDLVRGINNVKPCYQGGWLTIGNYDGLHLGHQEIVSKLVSFAREHQVLAQVLTFEPLPRAFFCKDDKPSRLMTFRNKYEYLESLGVDQLICLKFNKALASLEPEQFIKNYLVDVLNITGIIVGEDFKFGHQQKGDVETLKTLAKKYGFQVEICYDQLINNQRISSSLIRQALIESDFEKASSLLGRPFSLTAKVGHGEKRGRLLGFPTANLVLPAINLPLKGVYLVEVRLQHKPNDIYDGLINIGNRPTFKGINTQAEVHIVNFAQDIYAKRIHVQFISKIRDEQRFKSVEALKGQIQEDISAVKKNREIE